MQRIYILLIVSFLCQGHLSAELQETDSVSKKKQPQFVAVDIMGGIVLPTNKYIKSKDNIPAFGSLSLKYGISSSGDKWEDVAYGMPYYGVGIYAANFFNINALGRPFSIFLFQGGDLMNFNPRWSLKYELNLGSSFNWKYYDVFDNPDNIAIGSSVNVQVGANAYFKYRLSDVMDIHFGLGLTHFSNGANSLPNKGINLASPFIELVYNINANPINTPKKYNLTPPEFEKRIDYDLTLTISSRQIRVDTTGTGFPSRVLDRNFKVFGLSYATMFVQNYKYKWGPSLDLVYDESADVKVWREQNPLDGYWYDRVKLGKTHKRFSAGLSMKGEMTFPFVTFFAHLGYNLLQGNDYDNRFYQIIGAKAYIKDNLFATFGIRANRFTKAQYLYWSIGYTIKGNPAKKKNKYIHNILP